MIIFLTIVHVLICFFLIIVVLLQSGKAADLAGAFGGMGSQTAFGPRGAATLLSKATTTAAVLFMVTSIWLGIEETRQRGRGDSVIERTGADAAVPAAPETTPGESESSAGQGPAGIEVETSTIKTEPAAPPGDASGEPGSERGIPENNP